uniref:Putative secreted protein n=1 Tax=Ixodes ricinus TaxID=34613 RepID=A0A6B0TZX1_IXORI
MRVCLVSACHTTALVPPSPVCGMSLPCHAFRERTMQADIFYADTTPNFLPTVMKASTVRSMSSLVCAAEICTLILALPLGTTG